MNFREIEQEIDSQINAAEIALMYDEFEPHDPDVVFIREKRQTVIVINTASDSDVPVVARKAHELSHILDGDGAARSYTFSIGFKNDAEKIANCGMVFRLAKIVYADTPLENRNYIEFLNAFHLPNSFEDLVQEAIRKI